MLAAVGVSKFHGANVVLADVDLVVPAGARVGLVGPNGVGKSTLLRVLAGLEEPDRGMVTASGAVGYLPQETRSDETVRGYLARRAGVAAAEQRMDALAARLHDEPGLAAEYADALDAFLARGGDDFDARAQAACEIPLDREMATLSGGEAARAALASILLGRWDVLLLDEPTNDLDFAGLERLERFVVGHPGASVVVSHDRAFLDRVVTRIVELDEWTHGATEYTGGWSEYEAERARRLARHHERYEAYESEKERVEEQARRMRQWEERGYGQGRKKKKSKDLKKAYDRKLATIERVEKPYEPWELRLGLEVGSRSGDVVAALTDAVVERGGFTLGPISLDVAWGDRVAIVGANGSGKSTLLDALLGRVRLTRGARTIGPGVVLGELEQTRDAFGDAPLLDGFDPPAEEARTLLAKFGLGADDVLRPASSLSPGERTRASLALLAARGVNCLVLDEPTNHLDVEAIEELERALAGYDGTVLLVSHDRVFLDRFGATRTIALRGTPGGHTGASGTRRRVALPRPRSRRSHHERRSLRPRIARSSRTGIGAGPPGVPLTGTATIVTIGNELTSGDVANTNGGWIAKRLAPLGVTVRMLVAIPDEIEAIAELLRAEAPRVDFVLVTGGLGGTPDDLTREAIAYTFGVPQVEVPELARALRERFYKHPDYAAGWALLPRGASAIDNPLGGAPGFRIENVYVMPGLPAEMEAMFLTLEEELRRGDPIGAWRRTYRTGESQIATTLAEAAERWPGVLIGSYPTFAADGPTVDVVVKSSHADDLAAASSWLASAIEERS